MYIQNLNPTIINGSSQLEVLAEKTENLVIKILDVQGRIAKILITQVVEGWQQLMLDLDDLTSGNYVLNAFNEDRFVQSFRFIKP